MHTYIKYCAALHFGIWPYFWGNFNLEFPPVRRSGYLRTNAAFTALVKNSMKIDNNIRKMYELSQNKEISDGLGNTLTVPRVKGYYEINLGDVNKMDRLQIISEISSMTQKMKRSGKGKTTEMQ